MSLEYLAELEAEAADYADRDRAIAQAAREYVRVARAMWASENAPLLGTVARRFDALVARYKSHFATCPHASQHRKPRTGQGGLPGIGGWECESM